MIRLRLFKTQRHRHIFVGKHRTLEQTFTQNSFDGASECIPNNSEVAGFCQRPRYYSNFLLRKCKKQHLPTKFAVHDHREYKDNAKFAAQVERKFFHLTARQDVWPIILGAGVVYIGARFLQNYYAAKESGELHKSSRKRQLIQNPRTRIVRPMKYGAIQQSLEKLPALWGWTRVVSTQGCQFCQLIPERFKWSKMQKVSGLRHHVLVFNLY